MTTQSNKPPGNKTIPVWLQPRSAITDKREAIVIGSGLAGTSSARAMAERGWKVTLLEQKNELAAGASGNPQGMLYVRLSCNDTTLSRFSLRGYEYSRQRIQQLLADQPDSYDLCGVIQLASSKKEKQRHQRLIDKGLPKELAQYKNASELSQLAGITLDYSGLWFPGGGWVNPPALCKTLADHKNITAVTDCEVTTLFQTTNKEWELATSQGKMTAPVVIVACADKTRAFPQLQHIPLKPIRGQISTLPATSASSKLQTVICADSYVAPARQGNHTFGATFNLHTHSPEISEADHEENLQQLKKLSHSLHHDMQATPEHINNGRVGFRCTTPDYLPVIGPVVQAEQFSIDFAKLRTNARYPFRHTPRYYEGLYADSGHGSRGLISCLLSGELLAAEITDTPSPLPVELASQLNPNRFLARHMIRNPL